MKNLYETVLATRTRNKIIDEKFGDVKYEIIAFMGTLHSIGQIQEV